MSCQKRCARYNERGDLNRKFPPEGGPPTRLSRAIWDLAVDVDPDVTLNLHGSDGIYGLHNGFVGQAIFPTVTGGATGTADRVVDRLNREVVPLSMPMHDYRVGNVLRGTAPLFTHRVAAKLDRPGYIVETTSYLLERDSRVKWTARAAEFLLEAHGLSVPATAPIVSVSPPRLTAVTMASSAASAS